ncbi:MAG TPA: non-homologous end-joining DNA ligase [Jiangellaceae bacterium]|nr:non-homologous end-joining DNA ligase [Jiangellaceae bacterium]
MTAELRPMLAVSGRLPPTRDDDAWSYELKWDGVRMLAHVAPSSVRLVGRSGIDATIAYPELAGLSAALGGRTCVLDGEVAVLGADGSSDFGALAPRMHVRSATRAQELAVRVPVTYIVFDVLRLDGRSTLALPYTERRKLVEELVPAGPSWQVSPAFTGGGADLLEASRRMGVEGIVAKRLDSPYRPGQRSTEWVKVKNLLTQEVVIGGYTVGEGRRASTFGALLLGVSVPDGLVYVGSVGTGFDDRMLTDLAGRLRQLGADESPFVGQVDPRHARGALWVRPELVGEVAYGQWTSDGRMRHPVWRGLRPDKVPSEVVREG